MTYAEVGETGASVLPPGYRHERVSVSVGQGDTAFARCRQAIKMWQGHRYVGATLAPATPEIAVGVDVIVCLQIGPMFVVAPCRIVVVTDEADVFGFSYGTLPGHPERGEEAFHARRTEGGEVTFQITAFSRPGDPLVRLGRPIARGIQRRTTSGYLAGLRSYVTEDP